MNILVINGSPKGRRSNTYKLSKAFVKGVSEAAGSVCEELTVSDMDIRPCAGCFACWSKSEGECVIKDDMKDVLHKMLWADMVIWSFGLYYFNVPGKLKTFIDRQLPLALPFMVSESETGAHPARYDMSGKRHVVISTCGFYTAKGNYDSVNAMFDHFLGKNNYETVYCGQGELFRVPELHDRTDAYLRCVEQAGREYIQGGITAGTRKYLQELLYPRAVFESMADASWGIEKTTGAKQSEAFGFTKQMAALYNTNAYSGEDKVLEMAYTDIGERYQILMTRDGHEVIREDFKPFTTKIETPFSVWRDIASGKISGSEAMAKKLYRVEGDFELMLHWDNYFGIGETAPSKENPSDRNSGRGTSLLLTLIPWITFWVAVSINSFVGAFVSIGVCAMINLVFFRFRKTVYDVISAAAVTGLSMAVLLFPDTVNILLPVSYAAFGAMWCISCLFKIPLTAWYSMKNYGDNSALENPLFLRTNRILSLAWGVLYLATAVWTFCLMGTPVSPYLAIINNVVPIFMGIFTGWFQKWYPRYYAAK